MGAVSLHEAIVKYPSNPSPASNVDSVKTVWNASPPTDTMTNFLTSTFGESLHCERQTRLPHVMSSGWTSASVSVLDQSVATTTLLNNTSNKPTASHTTTLTLGTQSKTIIRRNCSYASVSNKTFPYYIPVPSSAKLNGKPKKYQSFKQTAIEQDQSVLSPSGSEGSSRDSGFNSDPSSPAPLIVSSNIDQLLDEIASLDDIN